MAVQVKRPENIEELKRELSDESKKRECENQARIEASRERFFNYIRHVFRGFKGQPYRAKWYHEHLADTLQKFAEPGSGLNRLAVFMPPQHGKSEQTSRMLPGWILGNYPDSQILACSYNSTLARRMSRGAKKRMRTDEYSEVFPETGLPESGYKNNLKTGENFWEVRGGLGSYQALGVAQGSSGNPADYILIDDPHDRESAYSETERESVWEWHTDSILTRVNDDDKILLVQTRWHPDDLAGRILGESQNVSRDPEDMFHEWTVIRYPALKEDKSDPKDPREPGEALWPKQKSRDALTSRKEDNPRSFSALYQQRPYQREGEILESEWLQERWKTLPGLRGTWIWVCDPKHGSKDPNSSQAVIQLWFRPENEQGRIYLVDEVAGIWSEPETEEKFKGLWGHDLWSRADRKLIESKGDGKALKANLDSEIPGLELIQPWASKVQRVRDISSYWRSGNVVIPHSERYEWVSEFEEQHKSFPRSSRDDKVDTSSYAIWHFFMREDEQESSNLYDEILD